MARKKISDSDVPAQSAPTPEEAPKPKTRRKKADADAPVAAAIEPVASPEPPKKTRTRAKKDVPTPEPVKADQAPKPKRAPRAKKVAETPVEVAPSTPAEPVSPTVVDADDDLPVAQFRSRSGKKAAPAKAEPEAAVEEPKKPARARRGKKEPEASVEDVFAGLDPDDDLPIPTFRPRSARATLVTEDVEADEASSEDEKSDGGRNRRRRRRRGGREADEAAPVAAAPAAEDDEESEPFSMVIGEEDDEDDLVLRPVFRKKGDETPAPKADAAEPKERDRRRGRDRKDRPVAAEVEAAEAIASPEVPKGRERRVILPAPKPLIPVPDDAPQVVLRDGVPTLVRNKRVYPPLFFFGASTDDRRSAVVMDQARMAAEAGVHLHQHLLEFTISKDRVADAVAKAGQLLSQTLRVDRDAQVMFRLLFIPPAGWQSRYSDAVYRLPDGSVADPSVCDEKFWTEARDCLVTFVQELRKHPEAANLLGIHLERNEWYHPANAGLDDSNAAREKFREWARARYSDDEVALRANWFDGDVDFENVQVPKRNAPAVDGDRFVRSSRKQRRYVDYHLFLSDATVHRIGDLAYAVKEASEGYFLVGCSYGYTFEWSHPASGHLSLGKLLRTPEIDFIAGPPSYRNREPGGAAPFPGPIDSFALNGKLYLSEEDFKTSLSLGHEPDDFNPMIKTPQALDSVHWRGAGAALAHAGGVSWMDLWGNGWLKTASVWERAQRILRAMTLHMAAPLADPDVVVFIDERALAYLVDERAFELLVQNAREAVLRAGVSAGFYLLSDLAHRERFPEAKLYLFLNAWDIRPELRAAIKSRLHRDSKVLFWLYSAGLFDSGREALERAREVTGIALKPQPFSSKSGTTILNRRHPLSQVFPSASIVGSQQLEPSYFAIPEEAVVLGEYSQTGLPSFVVKDTVPDGQGSQPWTSVFLGEPIITSALVRSLAQMAGAHIYDFTDDVVHVRPPFLTVHCTGAGPRTIALPERWSAFNVHTGQWVLTEGTNLRFQATDGSTHVFLIGAKEDLEHLISIPPDELLRMETLPPRPDNTIRQDSFAFDVPIMKLGTFMEGTDDEVADEWFLRPVTLPETTDSEPESTDGDSERIGRRRRRRRRGGGNGNGNGGDRRGSEESADFRPEPSGTPASFGDDFEINVVFRKRD